MRIFPQPRSFREHSQVPLSAKLFGPIIDYRMSFINDVRKFVTRQAAPVTMGIIAVLILVSVVSVLFHNAPIPNLLFTSEWLQKPWTLITYSFVAPISDAVSLLFFVFLIYWMGWVVATVERDMGTVKFSALWAVFTVLPPLLMYFGGFALKSPTPLVYSPELPLAGMTVIWGLRNKSAATRLFAILPVTGKLLAVFTVAATFLNYHEPNLMFGVLACLHLILAYLIAEDKIPGFSYAKPAAAKYVPSKAARAKEAAFLEDVRKREIERDERERLRKLFESSMDD